MKTTGKEGFGLIEVVISLGILSIGMMTMANMLLISAKTQNDIRVNSDIQSFVNRAQKIVDSQETCTASLVGDVATDAIVLHDPLVAGTVIATEGTSFSNQSWILQTLRLQNLVAFVGHPNVFRATLSIDASKDMSRVMGVAVIHRNLSDIYVEISPATDPTPGRITKCYGSTDQMDIASNNCLMLGGTWNAANAFGTQCTLPGGSTTLASGTTKANDPSISKSASGDASGPDSSGTQGGPSAHVDDDASKNNKI